MFCILQHQGLVRGVIGKGQIELATWSRATVRHDQARFAPPRP